MSGSKPEVFTSQIGNTEEPTPDEQHRAKLRVAEHAHGAADCRELLQILGLINPGFTWTQPVQSGSDKRRRIEEV